MWSESREYTFIYNYNYKTIHTQACVFDVSTKLIYRLEYDFIFINMSHVPTRIYITVMAANGQRMKAKYVSELRPWDVKFTLFKEDLR